MRTAVLCGMTLFCSSAAFAQAVPAPAGSPAATHSITLSGCVAGGNNAQPITLSNAMVLPAGDQASPAATPSPVPDAVSHPTTQPPPPTTGAAGTSGTAGTAGAAGTTGAAGAAGAAGSTGVAGSPTAAAGTVGTATAAGTAPAGSSASSVSGYRLSGTDMSGWIGRRVQLVGTMVPVAPAAASASPNATPILQEFRVVSVQAAPGDCPRP